MQILAIWVRCSLHFFQHSFSLILTLPGLYHMSPGCEFKCLCTKCNLCERYYVMCKKCGPQRFHLITYLTERAITSYNYVLSIISRVHGLLTFLSNGEQNETYSASYPRAMVFEACQTVIFPIYCISLACVTTGFPRPSSASWS